MILQKVAWLSIQRTKQLEENQWENKEKGLQNEKRFDPILDNIIIAMLKNKKNLIPTIINYSRATKPM